MNVKIPTNSRSNYKMIKKLSYLSIFLTAFLIFSTQVSASVNCENIYGGGQNCVSKGEIDIDKNVLDPKTGKFVNNLTISESKYKSGDQVVFEIRVTNPGDAALSSVEVKDIIPQYTSFVSGPGNFNESTKTLTYSLIDLKPKETRVDKIVVKVTNEGNFCVINQSIVSSEGMSDQDNSQFCIEKIYKVMAPPVIKETPPTGPGLLGLLGLIPAGLAGILLRRIKK